MSNPLIENYLQANSVYWSDSHEMLDFDKPYSCTSQICNQSFYDAPFFHYWMSKLRPNFNPIDEQAQNAVIYHRKNWELVYICQSLYERGMLSKGKRGVVFGVGAECLPDLFASYGCEILATDLNAGEGDAQIWIQTGQNVAGNLEKLNRYHFCDPEEFKEKVTYRDVDMNNIPADITDYDFCWSTCAFEHLGSLRHGMEFVKNSLKTLKPGGIAVHTTEFNIYSNEWTIDKPGLSLYRKRDIEKLVAEIEEGGGQVSPLDWHIGSDHLDQFIDMPPYYKKGMHLRLLLEGFPCTSIGLIIKKI